MSEFPLCWSQYDHHIIENMDLNICYFHNQIPAQEIHYYRYVAADLNVSATYDLN